MTALNVKPPPWAIQIAWVVVVVLVCVFGIALLASMLGIA